MVPDRQLQTIDHLVISVTDLERTLHWYTSSFDCEVVIREPGYAEIAFANLKIGFSLPSQQPPHMAFVRTDATTFGPMTLLPDGRRSTYLADPSGNLVEIIDDETKI